MIEIIERYGQLGVELLKESIREVRATGKTEDSIEFKIQETKDGYNLTFYGREYFKALETGRSPRKSTEYSGLDERLDEWMRVRGFQTKTSKKGTIYYKIGNNWYTGKSLAYMINKKGDKTYRDGGRQLYSDALDELMEEMFDKIIERL